MVLGFSPTHIDPIYCSHLQAKSYLCGVLGKNLGDTLETILYCVYTYSSSKRISEKPEEVETAVVHFFSNKILKSRLASKSRPEQEAPNQRDL